MLIFECHPGVRQNSPDIPFVDSFPWILVVLSLFPFPFQTFFPVAVGSSAHAITM